MAGVAAITANSANVTVRVGTSTITGNAAGALAGNGGSIISYGNNQVSNNTNPGAFTSTIPTS